MKGFVIAGERSGVGKTTITLALARAFKDQGLRVQCFKVGPDFIDPGFHHAVTGRVSRNLDGWMMGRQACLEVFAQHTRDCDIAIVEGVMGLYDGYAGGGDDGSTAQIAKWLDLPVLAVIDGGSFARTAGAVVLGFQQFDPDLNLTGVLFNRVAGERHFEMLRQGVAEKCSVNALGYIPRDPAWQMPERHLGLVMAHEQKDLVDTIGTLAQRIGKTVDLAAIGRFESGSALNVSPESTQSPENKIARIGIARDEAFCFYYQDNLDLLAHYGAELVYFSPLHDPALPDTLDGLYLGGGYPELHARQLSQNSAMRQSVQASCTSGKPVYAECGGFLYLLQSISDPEGNRFDMAGLFPAQAFMRSKLQRLGYVEAEASDTCPFLAKGQTIRGHEFHYSDISEMPADIQRCFTVNRKRNMDSFLEGYRMHSVLAGYLHLHFASQPAFARDFVQSAAQSP